jgi:hypothetical protein
MTVAFWQGYTDTRWQNTGATEFCYGGLQCVWTPLSMELALRCPSGAYNFEVVPRFWGQFMGPLLWGSCKKRHAGFLYREQAGRLAYVQRSAALHWRLSPAPKVMDSSTATSSVREAYAQPKHSAVGDCCAGQDIRGVI